MRRALAGAVAGAAGGLAWVAADRPLQALLRTDYSDVRVAGAALRLLGLPASRAAATAAHLALCAGAGAALAATRPPEPRGRLLALAGLEVASAWPVVRRLERAGARRGHGFDHGPAALAEAAAGRVVLVTVASALLRRRTQRPNRV